MTYDRTKYHYGIFTEILKRQNVYHGSKQVKCLSLVADLLRSSAAVSRQVYILT